LCSEGEYSLWTRELEAEILHRDMAQIGRPEHLHFMLIGAASSTDALSTELELLTGMPANHEALVA
jgi:hypothetical protein